jgi:predicted metal-dependent hydrolase
MRIFLIKFENIPTLWCGLKINQLIRARKVVMTPDQPQLEFAPTDTSEIVEIRRSKKRTRSVAAWRESGRLIISVPARMSRREIDTHILELTSRIINAEAVLGDDELIALSEELIQTYLQPEFAELRPVSITWSQRQRELHGSCTSVDRTIRISKRIATAPKYVIEVVLLHELVHLLHHDHNKEFNLLAKRHPRLVEAEAFLAGMSHADSY